MFPHLALIRALRKFLLFDTVTEQDILVINDGDYAKEYDQLAEHRVILYYHGVFIFMRKKLTFGNY